MPVSSVTRAGLDALIARVDVLAGSVPQRGTRGLFRLPVDRVFTMRGFATVTTGTMISGTVRKDDEVEILPAGRRAKVRGIQVHGEAVERASALCKARGAKRAMPLPVSAPFHCALMQPAQDRLAPQLAALAFADPQPPLVNNVDAAVVRDSWMTRASHKAVDLACISTYKGDTRSILHDRGV